MKKRSFLASALPAETFEHPEAGRESFAIPNYTC